MKLKFGRLTQELPEQFYIYIGKKLGHDDICYDLGEYLQEIGYEVTYMSEYYRNLGSYTEVAGEVDITAELPGKEIYFEVKGNYTENGKKKARQQLIRHLDHLNPEALTYEVYGNSDGYTAYRFDSNGR